MDVYGVQLMASNKALMDVKKSSGTRWLSYHTEL